MSNNNDNKGPSVKFPPPLVFVLVMLGTYGLHYYLPLEILNSASLKLVGWALIVLGAVTLGSAMSLFKKAETNVEPWEPTTAIVTTGIYKYSRNPIYAAFCLIQVGVGMVLNSVWIAGSVFLSAYIVYLIAIKKEETYLESKFGEEYLSYKNKVRRWL